MSQAMNESAVRVNEILQANGGKLLEERFDGVTAAGELATAMADYYIATINDITKLAAFKIHISKVFRERVNACYGGLAYAEPKKPVD